MERIKYHGLNFCDFILTYPKQSVNLVFMGGVSWGVLCKNNGYTIYTIDQLKELLK
jgi:hypothetical protein